MPTIEKTAHSPAAPAAVWAVAADPARLGDWLTLHRGWQGEAPTRLVEGTTVSAVLQLLGLPVTVAWTVQTYREPSAVRLTGTGLAGVEVSLELRFTTSADVGTDLALVAEFGGALLDGPIGAALDSAVRTEIDRSTELLLDLVSVAGDPFTREK